MMMTGFGFDYVTHESDFLLKGCRSLLQVLFGKITALLLTLTLIRLTRRRCSAKSVKIN